MTDPDELGRTISAVARAFDVLETTWAIGGSLASAAYGEPRATNDIDVIALLDERGARELTRLLGADFYADVDMAVEAVRRRSSFNVIDTRGFMKVDVFVPPPGALGSGQLDRRIFLELVPGAAAVPVLGAADVILQKLRWFAMGSETSDRQWRDIISVLRGARAEIDSAYLDQVATGDLRRLLDRARSEATHR